jgi:ATP/maltotriose-dependent transcriptional regulator MalT
MPTPQATEASARNDRASARPLLTRAFDNARAGRVATALIDLDRVRVHDWGGLGDLDRVALLTTALDCRLARGDLGAALGHAEDLAPFLDHAGLVGATAHYGRGELSAATGDADLAAGHFDRVGRLLGSREDPAMLPWRVDAALAAVRLGHRAEAQSLAHDHLVRARAAGSAYAVALGLRTLATVDAHRDRTGTLREARAALGGEPAERLAAQIDTDLAGLLVLSGRPDDEDAALSLLRSAERYAGREELWPLQGRIRRLLDRLGEAPRPVLSEALATLTAAESRVARLAADGMTNREIGERLVVSVKAVEWHLSHVYRKLGIGSRRDLLGALGLTA